MTINQLIEHFTKLDNSVTQLRQTRRKILSVCLHAIFSPYSEISRMDLLNLSTKIGLYAKDGLILPEDEKMIRTAIDAKNRFLTLNGSDLL